MLVDDRIIAEIIVRIGRHYNENIATRFLRPLFAQILSNIDLSRHIVDLTEHSDDFVLQGFHLDDLYYDIIALARFISDAMFFLILIQLPKQIPKWRPPIRYTAIWHSVI